jgi:hypothetical protein
MKLMTRARAGYLATLAVGAGIGIALVGVAAASPAAPAKTKTVTHHYSLAASAFAPDGLHDTAEDYFNQWDPTTLSNSDSGRCFNAGLSLPTGVTMKSITVYYVKGSASMTVNFNRQNLTKHAFKELVDFVTGTTTGTPVYSHTTRKIPKSVAMVDYTNFAYSMGVCPSGNTEFSGITITYTQPA